MNRCPITYEVCDNQRYSAKGLRQLSRNLQDLRDFPYSHDQQIELANSYATKLSLQGVQPKFCANLTVSKQEFRPIDKGGRFIMKPAHLIYKELPQNEDLTMRLAAVAGIEVPMHGMVYCEDDSLIYFVKRFDRDAKGKKYSLEDFSQLSGGSRDTKYDSSMERLVPIIDSFCTFPLLEKVKLLRLALFCFLIGNEDLHLKNLSLLQKHRKVQLSPAYDLVNSCILLSTSEELALPLAGKKSQLKRRDFIEYYGVERLGLRLDLAEETLMNFKECLPKWHQLIEVSFLSDLAKSKYLSLVQERAQRLDLT